MVKPKKGSTEEVTDARFAAVHRDPRFSRFPRKHTSVVIDERFKGMFQTHKYAREACMYAHTAFRSVVCRDSSVLESLPSLLMTHYN